MESPQVNPADRPRARTEIYIHARDLPKVAAYRSGAPGQEVAHVVVTVPAGANVDAIVPGASFMCHVSGDAVVHMNPEQARAMMRQIERGLNELEAWAQLAAAS